ncbi:excinuclease ABC subunit UvrC [Rickettsiales endosymbiont of Trichoplax sp. H2]|uniref:excinuclease ABC subunit UvrC n=1 Tax=Rickettsiales endosymbiont of Trichoplax sp. H2 TaxID=2021221 RepID=UPI0012B19FA5|nr:excinuclease ABC subunit UvrC [Rickettsiales endosymbiont of Trichoplax sp. H2]MSO13533.1 UvrABC system protein C [Rickettsiales endosymbiont of Trichoplax sp. H2]
MNQNIKKGIDVIKACVNNLASKPGIYKMICKSGEIIYIGKAKNLKKRVSQYANINNLPYRLKRMISLIYKIDILFTKSEIEALILEADLIKSIKPKYNIALKDDKSFPYIILDKNHNFPKIKKFRGKKNEASIFYGPFLSVEKLDKVIVELQKLFLVRNCTDYYFTTRKRPCLMYQIKRCSAPCVGKITKEDYQIQVNSLKKFLSGKSQDLISELIKEMDCMSNNMQYEGAAVIRDKIKLLNYIKSKSIFQGFSSRNIDIFIYKEDIAIQKYCIKTYVIRDGHSFGDKCEFFDKNPLETIDEVIYKYIIAFYQNNYMPNEIWCNNKIKYEVIKQAINKQQSYQTKVLYPKNSGDEKIFNFVIDNTQEEFKKYRYNYLAKIDIFKDLMNKFDLSYIPEKIEVYDNSHNHGANPVGCVVVVGQDGFIKNEYRKYKIKLEKCMDDYQMLREVIRRRFKNINYTNLPDLVLIDGGKGQLTSVMDEFKKLDIHNINVVAMSKGINRNSGREFFHQKSKSSFQIDKNNKTLLFLQNIRDEAHRYAITTHRNLMRKNLKKSELDSIKGIGLKRRKSLFLHFNSINDLKLASEDEIAKIKGINKELAKNIFQYIHNLE